MSSRAKVAAAVGGVLVLAVGLFFLISNRGDVPVIGGLLEEDPVECPLTGIEPRNEARASRPAVAVKIENAAVAYPLSGLDQAELVFEEPVEGGATRFMAIYQCTDAAKAGPVRSARIVDPSIMVPITRILAFSGANATVFDALDEAGIVQVEENTAGGALQRIPREGLTFEHTLYGDTAALRRVGRRSFSDPPPEGIFSFGESEARGRRASSITIDFGGTDSISYTWSPEGWLRSQNGAPFEIEGSGQLVVDNVLIEEHEVRHSTTIRDPAGNPSIEIADETGTGRAVLYRNGRAIGGTWSRETIGAPVVFTTRAGDEMVFERGSIWVHLVPSATGDVKGSFSHAR